MLIASIGGLLYLFLPRRREEEQAAGENPSSPATLPGSGAAPTLTVSDAGAPTDGPASVSDPTAAMFLLVLIVSVAALIYMYPRTAPQPPRRTEDD